MNNVAKKLDLQINMPRNEWTRLMRDPKAYARFCWESYGRFLGPETEASVVVNVRRWWQA